MQQGNQLQADKEKDRMREVRETHAREERKKVALGKRPYYLKHCTL